MLQHSVRGIRAMSTRGKRGGKKAAAAAASGPTQEMDGFAQMVQPKLQLHGVPSRYANALYSVAAKNKQLEAVEKELNDIQGAIQKDVNFKNFLKDPTIPRHTKKESITQLMNESKASPPVAGLFSVLAENGRLKETSNVVDCYSKLMKAYRGEVNVTVISADALSNPQLKQVEKALSNLVEKNETLVIDTKVEPEILGGLKVHIGNKFIDLSLSTKINKIQSILSQPVA